MNLDIIGLKSLISEFTQKNQICRCDTESNWSLARFRYCLEQEPQNCSLFHWYSPILLQLGLWPVLLWLYDGQAKGWLHLYPWSAARSSSAIQPWGSVYLWSFLLWLAEGMNSISLVTIPSGNTLDWSLWCFLIRSPLGLFCLWQQVLKQMACFLIDPAAPSQ